MLKVVSVGVLLKVRNGADTESGDTLEVANQDIVFFHFCGHSFREAHVTSFLQTFECVPGARRAHLQHLFELRGRDKKSMVTAPSSRSSVALS